MKSLRKLRFFIATYRHESMDAPPIYNRDIDQDEKLPTGAIYYRQMMRDLVAHVRDDIDVKLGMDIRDEQMMYYNMDAESFSISSGYIASPPTFMPASFLEQTFEEFKDLRGVEVGCYIED
jgi:hypothetical protein